MRRWGSRKDLEWSAAVLREYGRVCHLRLPGCTIVATTADHIVPRSVDISLEHDVSNGRPACFPCNRRRSSRPLASRPRVDARGFFESAADAGSDITSSPPRESGKSAGTAPRERRS